jgi:7-carboxy-7-deazaguanine synthase
MTTHQLSLTNDFVFYTVQGEGRYVGTPSIFIRLSGCNLRCTWRNPDGSLTTCDTPYSSLTPEKRLATVDEVVDEVRQYPKGRHVVVTGGEPFLQENMPVLVESLTLLGKFVTIETNGTIYKQTSANFLSISPKLSSASFSNNERFLRQQQKNRRNMEALIKHIESPHQLKFVVNTVEDVEEVKLYVKELESRLNRPYDQSNIYLMPQGVTEEQFDQRMSWIVEAVRQHGWNLSDRLHIRIWGNKRAI